MAEDFGLEIRRERERLELMKRRVLFLFGIFCLFVLIAVYVIIPQVVGFFGRESSPPNLIVFVALLLAGLVMVGLMRPAQALEVVRSLRGMKGMNITFVTDGKEAGNGKRDEAEQEDGDAS